MLPALLMVPKGGVVSGISGGSISVSPMESDAHIYTFNDHLFIGCKLHEGRTLLILFSGTQHRL